MDGIPPALLNGVGVGALLALLFYMLATGRLMTRSQHEEIVQPKDETIEFQRATIEKLTTATQNLAVPAHTAATALRSISREAEKKSGDEA